MEDLGLQNNAVRRRLLSTALIVFLCAMILANIASRMHDQLVPLYVQSLGASVEQVGLFFTITSIVPLAFQIIGGFVSDSIGRLRAVAMGSVAGAVGYLLFIVAPSWGWLMLAASISSLAGCFVGPSFQAFIAEQSTEETRGRVFAIVESLFTVVGVVGPPLGGFIAERYGFREMFMVAGALYVAATAIRLGMAARDRKAGDVSASRPTLKGLWSKLTAMYALIVAGGAVTWLFLSDGVADVAWSIASRLEPLYQTNLFGLSPTQIGTLSSVFHFVLMVLLPAGGWFSDKFGERTGIVLGHLLFSVGRIVFLLSTGFAGFAAAWAVFAVGSAVMRPAYNALISKVVPLSMRGTAFGLVATSLGVLSLPAPYIGGLMWRHLGVRAPFFVPLVAGLVVAPLLWVKLAPERIAETRGE